MIIYQHLSHFLTLKRSYYKQQMQALAIRVSELDVIVVIRVADIMLRKDPQEFKRRKDRKNELKRERRKNVGSSKTTLASSLR